jgi:uncharacterized Rmd1/YagE family protein
MKQIGSLFILRINWGGSILETPVSFDIMWHLDCCHIEFPNIAFLQEFFWSYPDLEPLYQATRSYFEIGTRIDLLNARVEVSLVLSFHPGKTYSRSKLLLRSCKTCLPC